MTKQVWEIALADQGDNEGELILASLIRLRHALTPRITAPQVRLRFIGEYFPTSRIELCLMELEQVALRAQQGTPPTELEKLAHRLLRDSAGANAPYFDEK